MEKIKKQLTPLKKGVNFILMLVTRVTNQLTNCQAGNQANKQIRLMNSKDSKTTD